MQAQLVNGWWECEREVKGQKSKGKSLPTLWSENFQSAKGTAS